MIEIFMTASMVLGFCAGITIALTLLAIVLGKIRV